MKSLYSESVRERSSLRTLGDEAAKARPVKPGHKVQWNDHACCGMLLRIRSGGSPSKTITRFTSGPIYKSARTQSARMANGRAAKFKPNRNVDG